jgi:hypothetical protein
MQEYALGVGDELVIDGHVRLTLVAVGAGEALLACPASETHDGANVREDAIPEGVPPESSRGQRGANHPPPGPTLKEG